MSIHFNVMPFAIPSDVTSEYKIVAQEINLLEQIIQSRTLVILSTVCLVGYFDVVICQITKLCSLVCQLITFYPAGDIAFRFLDFTSRESQSSQYQTSAISDDESHVTVCDINLEITYHLF